MYDVSLVKSAASGRWSEIFQSLGISADHLTGQHTACPKCGGNDRFRLLDEEAGALICNQCFREKNGDGIAAVQWFLGCNFQEALTRVADYLGVGPEKKTSKKAADPEEHLEFLEWSDDLAAYWCNFVKPGVTLDGLRRAGAVRVRYRNQFVCLAIPVYGEKLLAAKPVGWALYPLSCDKLPVYAKGKTEPAWEKMKLTAGSGRGVVGKFTAEQIGKATTVYKVEGVTDLLTMLSQPDITASEVPITNANGAGEKWKPWMLELLRGKSLVVVHDCDQPGQDGAKTLLGMSGGIVSSGKNIIPPFPIKPDHGEDLRDWFNGSGNLDLLRQWAVNAKAVEPSDVSVEFKNFIELGDESRDPLLMRTLVEQTQKSTGSWPRRVGMSLFVDDEKHGIGWLSQPPDLFGWLSSKGQVKWANGVGFVKQSEFFSELRRTSQCYQSVEEMPHEPPLADHYYRCGEIQPTEGGKLRELLDRFNFSTEVDRDLFLAAIVTPCWGGPLGARPAFLITSPDGRGSGKSTAAKMLGRIWGGLLSFTGGDDANKMTTRLLSPDALSKRVATLDNVKSMKFSWSTWEALLTADNISGHKLYAGEAFRPNSLTWLITANGASLSTDIAQRVVTISLRKPTRSGSWEEETAEFIDANRAEIISDCIGFLRGAVYPLAKFTRWGAWEKDVLQRLPEPNEAQKVILERQDGSDAEADEAELIEDFFGNKLADLTYEPEVARVFIPSAIMAEWMHLATGEKITTVAAGRKIGQLIDEGRVTRIDRNRCRSWGRGFVWVGSASDQAENISTDIEARIDRRKNGFR